MRPLVYRLATECGLAGWVANRIDKDCENPDDNVLALQERLDAPLLADFGYAGDAGWPQLPYPAIDLQPLLASRASF